MFSNDSYVFKVQAILIQFISFEQIQLKYNIEIIIQYDEYEIRNTDLAQKDNCLQILHSIQSLLLDSLADVSFSQQSTYALVANKLANHKYILIFCFTSDSQYRWNRSCYLTALERDLFILEFTVNI